jgi:hypothetical protein
MAAWKFTAAILFFGLCAAAPNTYAQDAVLNASDDAPAASWSWFGDAILRYEDTEHLPGARYNHPLKRERGRARLGGIWSPMPTLEFGAAIELGAGSDSNRDNRLNNDNERSNGANLDQFFLRWHAGEHTSVLAGKAPFPFELSPLTWDRDLRPAGLSIDHSIALNDFDRLQFTAGWFAGQHLYRDDSRIGALQVAWRWHDGAPTRASVILSWLDFSNLDQLAKSGLGRTNQRIGGLLVNDYRLLDLQLVGRSEFVGRPLEARLDLLRNTGADTANEGARGSLVLGDRSQSGRWEFGLAYQRIQRDAALAAFNEDDWWFHSFARGAMPWVGYGLAERWSVRLAEFNERLDGLDDTTRRILLDVETRW